MTSSMLNREKQDFQGDKKKVQKGVRVVLRPVLYGKVGSIIFFFLVLEVSEHWNYVQLLKLSSLFLDYF